MNITDLPPDAMRETLFHLPPDDVINYCTSSKDILEQCNDYPFLKNYVYNNYGLEIDSIKINGSSWDKFVLINNLFDQMNSLTNSSFILDDRRFYSHEFYVTGYISPQLDKILASAMSTENPKLLSELLRIFSLKEFGSVPAVFQAHNFSTYDVMNHLLMNTYLTALSRTTLERVKATIIVKVIESELARNTSNELLLTYYKSLRGKMDPMLYEILREYIPGNDKLLSHSIIGNAVAVGNIALVNKLILSLWVDPGLIQLADLSGQTSIATLLRDHAINNPEGFQNAVIDRFNAGERDI